MFVMEEPCYLSAGARRCSAARPPPLLALVLALAALRWRAGGSVCWLSSLRPRPRSSPRSTGCRWRQRLSRPRCAVAVSSQRGRHPLRTAPRCPGRRNRARSPTIGASSFGASPDLVRLLLGATHPARSGGLLARDALAETRAGERVRTVLACWRGQRARAFPRAGAALLRTLATGVEHLVQDRPTCERVPWLACWSRGWLERALPSALLAADARADGRGSARRHLRPRRRATPCEAVDVARRRTDEVPSAAGCRRWSRSAPSDSASSVVVSLVALY